MFFKKWREKRKLKKEAKNRLKTEATELVNLEKLKIHIFDLERKMLREALMNIMATNIRVKNSEGKEVTDMYATISAMKTTARITLETVDNLKKSPDVQSEKEKGAKK